MELTLGSDFFIRLCINTFAILVLVRGCYFQYSQHRSNASSFILFGVGVFLVTSLLHSADISMGFAFGLFAVFSMLRYRTESIGVKEMTYLFLVISIALLGAVGPMAHLELAILAAFICLVTYLLETSLVLPLLCEMEISYEKIENIPKHRHLHLINDLAIRTGLDVQKVEVISIDFLRDSARLKVHYKLDTAEKESVSGSTEYKQSQDIS